MHIFRYCFGALGACFNLILDLLDATTRGFGICVGEEIPCFFGLMISSEDWLERSGDIAKKGGEDETVLSFPSEIGRVGGDDVSNGDFGFKTNVGPADEAMKIIAF